jgi:uracil-DNA glycosylase family 4
MVLENLTEQILCCKKCRLWNSARNAVPGEGPPKAKIMFVGQNPGTEEDKVGRPFVGRSGKFLDKVLTSNGINRNDVFVTNIVKHVTPNNRKPLPDEVEKCIPYLVSQVNLIKPKVIVLMGTVAAQMPREAEAIYIETVHPSAAMRFTKMRKRFLEKIEALTTL